MVWNFGWMVVLMQMRSCIGIGVVVGDEVVVVVVVVVVDVETVVISVGFDV